jgi:cellulose synthase/poly-beta-1,6-N-acetylglucosamine synthase-like glycosyltransferase
MWPYPKKYCLCSGNRPVAKIPKVKRIEWIRIGEVILLFMVLPTLIFYLVVPVWPAFLHYSYYFIITVFVLQGLFSFVNSFSALGRKRFVVQADIIHRPVPKTSFIISAYLPNEVDVVEGTILNIVQNVERPANGIEVILAYNTPHLVDIETRLKELAYQYPELILANAHGSRSKSENLNYTLEQASGEMIVLLDADHLVEPACLKKAWRWLERGYDAVQGRCKIRNTADGIIPKIVAVEFEVIYGIMHFAKSRLFDTALFGGSNGYWRAEVLKSIKFRTDRLTEDIDATIRALLKGHRIVHDRSIVSTEEAPFTAGSLWHQRKRWAQGWFQVSMYYQLDVFRTEFFNFRQRFLWTTLLWWRVFYDIISHFLFPVVFAYWLYRKQITLPVTPYILFTIIVTLASGPLETLVSYKNAAKPKNSIFHFLFYALITFPYTLFKNTIQTVAILDELQGKKEWIVSERVKK